MSEWYGYRDIGECFEFCFESVGDVGCECVEFLGVGLYEYDFPVVVDGGMYEVLFFFSGDGGDGSADGCYGNAVGLGFGDGEDGWFESVFYPYYCVAQEYAGGYEYGDGFVFARYGEAVFHVVSPFFFFYSILSM